MVNARLTLRQSEVYTFIQERLRTEGVIPTLQEICQRFGFRSINSAREHVRLIERKGLLHRSPGQPRAIKLLVNLARFEHAVSVPLLGRIPAGEPTAAFQETED